MRSVEGKRLRSLLPPINNAEALLVYDGHCPICESLALASRVRSAGITMRLMDARENTDLVHALRREVGIDLNRQFLIATATDAYVGADAMSWN